MSFAFYLVKQAVNPRLSIDLCLQNWSEISKDLAEAPRKRKFQMNCLS